MAAVPSPLVGLLDREGGRAKTRRIPNDAFGAKGEEMKVGDRWGVYVVKEIDERGILRVEQEDVCDQCGYHDRVWFWAKEEDLGVGMHLISRDGHSCLRVLHERLSLMEMELSKLKRREKRR